MAKKPLILCLGFCLAVIMLLAGCSPFGFRSMNDLLRAPALGREQGEIQKALADTLNEKPQYKYPKEGENRSPLLMADLNNDGKDEGVVLYTMPGVSIGSSDAGGTVNVAVLEMIEDSWTVTQDVKGWGTEVASFQIADLLGNGTKQILVGYGTAGLKNKELGIYQYENGKLERVQWKMPYSKYAIGDFTGRGMNDLMMVSLESLSEQPLQLYYLPTKDGQFLESQKVPLNANFESCAGLYPSIGPDDKRVVVVDGVVKNMLVSQLIYYPNEEGQFYTYAEPQRVQIARQSMILKSRDIDGDGVVEIPRRVGLNEISTPAGKKFEFVEWLDFTGTASDAGAEPVVKQFGILDPEREVYVRLPEEWRDQIKVIDGSSKSEWDIVRSDTMKNLLKLKVLSSGQEIPDGAIRVYGYPGTYIVPSKTLGGLEVKTINSIVLS